jgi:branched-chain amino acid transport system permease protein
VLIGGYLGYTFLVPFGLPIWASLLLAIAVAIVLGLLIERFAIRPLVGQPELAMIMMTIALATVLEGLATLIWGGEYKTYHSVMPTVTLKLGQISIPPESLIGLIVSVTAVVLLMVLFRYTKIGLAMRATAEDLQVVQSVGIKATTVYAVSWVIACVVGVIGGMLLGGVSGVMIPLAEIGLKAFAVVLLGGVNSIGGAIVAGIILGVLENVAAGYLDPLLPGGGLAQIFPFVVMIVVLIFRPYGLFGLARIERI